MPYRILVPLDRTRFAEAALPLALRAAVREDATLHLATVWSPLPSLLDSSRWVTELQEWEMASRAEDRSYLTAIARKVREASARPVSVRYLLGHPAEELARFAREEQVDLVVMSTHGQGGLTRAWVGSVADRMVRKGSAPVLLARPSESNPEVRIAPAPPFRRILVPLDGSPLAEAALERSAFPEANEETEVALLHVTGLLTPLASPEGPLTSDLTGRILEAERKAAEAYLARVAERIRPWGFRVTTRVLLSESAWTGIVEHADSTDCDLIAMATHGRGGAARVFLGSVADRVLRASSVPTLLFPPRTSVGERAEPHAQGALAHT
jgi:nucleotide-binding universal stress UspA family protein